MATVAIALLGAACIAICACAMAQANRCDGCAGFLNKNELMDVLDTLPDTTRVYITIRKE